MCVSTISGAQGPDSWELAGEEVLDTVLSPLLLVSSLLGSLVLQ